MLDHSDLREGFELLRLMCTKKNRLAKASLFFLGRFLTKKTS